MKVCVCVCASSYRSEIGFCGFVLPRQFHSWNKIDHMEYILEYVQKKVHSRHWIGLGLLKLSKATLLITLAY